MKKKDEQFTEKRSELQQLAQLHLLTGQIDSLSYQIANLITYLNENPRHITIQRVKEKTPWFLIAIVSATTGLAFFTGLLVWYANS